MSLIYKDYLDEDEAADYMCVSKSCFNEHKDEWGIVCHRLPGVVKNVYKRHELQAIMENGLKPWRPNIKEGASGISSGVMEASIALASLKNSASKRRQRRKPIDSQRNSNSGQAQP